MMKLNYSDRNGKNKIQNNSAFKKYSINNSTVYYNLTELLIFLKKYFNIDYENYILKVRFIIILTG
jgi:hypothetical protein